MAIIQWISTLIGKIMRAWTGRYRPERHYMRGAGPASTKEGSGKPEPLDSTELRQTISGEPQDLPCVAGALVVTPLNGSRVCLASRLWSSQIFCDSATEVS
jgi:hypothetical protein